MSPPNPAGSRAVTRDIRLASIASSILGSNLVTSVLGLVFWMMAARGLVPAELGQLGAATGAMSFFGALGAMGLGPLLIAELPRLAPREQRELFVVSAAASLLVGGIPAMIFGAVMGPTSQTWAPVGAPSAGWIWLGVGSALTAASMVFDQAMLVVGNPQIQVVRNLVASLWKVALLGIAMWAARAHLDVALGAWTTGLFLAALLAVHGAYRRMPSGERLPLRHSRGVIARYGREALAHQGVNYAMSISAMAMPPLIATLVDPRDNAIYTTVRLATLFGFMVPYAVSVSVFARASGNDDVDGAYLRKVFWMALALSLAVCVVMIVIAPWALWPFGAEYVDAGVGYLQVMILAAPLLVFKDQYIARKRIERQLRLLLYFVIVSAVTELGFTLIGAWTHGLMGAIVGWLLALALQAVYTARALMHGGDRGGRPSGTILPSDDGDPTQPPQDADLQTDDRVPQAITPPTHAPGTRAAGRQTVPTRALSVVVCAYTDERWSDLVHCVESLRRQIAPVREIVLIIDHNTDLLDRSRLQWPDLRVEPSAGPRGLSGARNTGWALCSGSVVAFIDDDAAAETTWSEDLMRAYDERVLGVGGGIDPVWPKGEPPSWWPPTFNWVVGCSYVGMPHERTPVRNAIGANMSVRREVLIRVNGFATSLGRVGKVPLGAEETAMYLHAGNVYQDMTVLYEPAARVRHRVTAERATFEYFAKRCFGEGRSKARMARMKLAPKALGTERAYVTRTLPVAMVRGLLSADPRRGLAVVAGLAFTTAGYLQELVTVLISFPPVIG